MFYPLDFDSEPQTTHTSSENNMATLFVDEVLRQSSVAFMRIYNSSYILRNLLKAEQNQEQTNQYRTMSQPSLTSSSSTLSSSSSSSIPASSSTTAACSLLYICETLNKNYRKYAENSNNVSITEKCIWSILSEVNEFSIERAIDCIKRFIHMWIFHEKWYFKVSYNRNSATTDSNRHRFNAVFSLIDLKRFQPFETCTVAFHFVQNEISVIHCNAYKITYQFEQMQTEFPIDIELFHFQESFLQMIINQKLKIKIAYESMKWYT